MNARSSTQPFIYENPSFKLNQAAPSETCRQPVEAETNDLTPAARKFAYITLTAAVVFLAAVAAYVWYGSLQWLKLY